MAWVRLRPGAAASQEDLIAFLGRSLGDDEVRHVSEELRIDLAPPAPPKLVGGRRKL